MNIWTCDIRWRGRGILHVRYHLTFRSPCQDPAGTRTTRWPPDHSKETQIAVVWSCLPFIRSGQNDLARQSERGKKSMQTEEEVGRQLHWMDRPWVRQVPEGSGEQGKMEKLVAKSSVEPQRPSRLRDRWWWWWRSRLPNELNVSLISTSGCTMVRYIACLVTYTRWHKRVSDHREDMIVATKIMIIPCVSSCWEWRSEGYNFHWTGWTQTLSDPLNGWV